jgi:hypothetical protein
VSCREVLAGVRLAAVLSREGFQVLHPSMDGFHHPRERRPKRRIFTSRLLRGRIRLLDRNRLPSGAVIRGRVSGLVPVVAQNVRTDRRDESPAISVGANAVLLFEGVFLFRRVLNAPWDFRIFSISMRNRRCPGTCLTAVCAGDETLKKYV